MSSHGQGSISGRYAMYKEGGNRITRWLVSTATFCRRSLTAKSAAKGKVSTKELLNYAELVVSWKPPIEIPANITDVLEDVIIGREVCAEFYVSQNMACEGHQHMIEVLHKVLAILLEARRKRNKDRTKDKKKQVMPEKVQHPKQNSEEALNNLFANLQMEEPCDEAQDVAPKKKAAQPTVSVAKPTLEVSEKEEKMFALFCFLKDMQELRNFVQDTWREYADKKIAVVTATMVTETALSIMSLANESLIESHPDLAEIKGVLAILDLQFGADSDGKPGFHDASKEPQGLPVDNELVRMLCPEAAVLVDQLQTLFNDAKGRAKERRASGASTKEQWHYDEESTPPKGFSSSPFGTLLYGLFPDLFRLVDRYKSYEYIPPAFLRGLVEVGYKNKACLWFISAVQIYSDIHELTRGATAPFRQHCMMNVRSMRALIGFHTLLLQRKAQPTTLCSHTLEATKLGLGRIVARTIPTMEYDLSAYKETLMSDTNWLPVRVWSALPAESGYMIDDSIFWISGAGNDLANDAAIILATAYLYKACRHAGLPLQPWRDMDWFLEHVGQERPFIHEVGPEGNMATFVRRLYLGIGVSAAAFSYDNGRSQIRDSRSGKQAFEQRRIFRTGSEYLRLVDELSRGDRDEGLPQRYCVQTALQKVMSRRLQDRSSISHKQGQRQVEFTGLQMLTFFKQQRSEDEPGLHFDLISFFTDCVRLLWELRVEWKGQDAAMKPQWDYIVVADILHDGSRAEASGTPLASSAMGDAAGILGRYISKQGSRHTDEAFTLARGEIPAAWSDEAAMLAEWTAKFDRLKAKLKPGDPTASESRSMTDEVGPAASKHGPVSCSDSAAGKLVHQAQVEDVDEGST